MALRVRGVRRLRCCVRGVLIAALRTWRVDCSFAYVEDVRFVDAYVEDVDLLVTCVVVLRAALRTWCVDYGGALVDCY